MDNMGALNLAISPLGWTGSAKGAGKFSRFQGISDMGVEHGAFFGRRLNERIIV